ncbi:unnamed protein product, partial [Echinostoma caproni]|uniref:tRNA wybutosine-synthesizing protein 2 homolog n=1 Tax=Echinostoma caproni TaxID=27848 RepID=A0A183B1M1_9TREM
RVVTDLVKCHSSDPACPNRETTSPPGRVVVYDVFAGVGPFAIPAARRGCRVFANDLNPASYEWLMRNVQANRTAKRSLDNITCYNLDGREFIRKVVLPHYWSSVDDGPVNTSSGDDELHPLRYVVVMNLPALAPDFLDAFLHPQPADELLSPNSSDLRSLSVDVNCADTRPACGKRARTAALPLDVYCYCFVRRTRESEDTIKQRLASALGYAKNPTDLFDRAPDSLGPGPRVNVWSFRFVRNVAPFKDMFCAEFQLTLDRPETALEHELIGENACRVDHKKPKLEA